MARAGSLIIQMAVDLARLRSDLSSAAQITSTRLREIERSAKQASTQLSNMGRSFSQLQSLVVGSSLVYAVRSLVEARVAYDALGATLKTVTGTQAGANREWAYATTLARELGLDYNVTTQVFVKLAAAARGTALEGKKLHDIFTAFAKTTRVLGLSADDQQRIFMALTQMISKGNVQAEELRGQLGERLPGAFQLAAKAMGVTTRELGEMLKQGKVLAEDLLPKLAVEMEKAYGAGAAEAARTLGAQMERLNTQWINLKTSLSVAGGGTLGGGAGYLEQFFGGLAVAMGNAIDPMDRVELQIRSLQNAIAVTQAEKDDAWPQLVGEDEEAKLKRLNAELARLIQLQQEMLGLGVAGRDTALNIRQRIDAKNAPPPKVEPTEAELKAAAAARAKYLKELADSYADVVKSGMTVIQDMESPAEKITRKFEEQKDALQKLANTYPGLRDVAQEAMARAAVAADDALEALKRNNGEVERHNKLMEDYAQLLRDTRTPVEEWAATVEHLTDILRETGDSDAFNRGLAKANEELSESTRKLSSMSVFAEEAARNMQSAFADFLFDPFKDGLKGMLASFTDTIRRMIAEAAAAEILRAFFDWAGGAIGGETGSFISGLGKRAAGGPVTAGGAYLVGEKGPELFMPRTNGMIMPSGTGLGGVTVNYAIDARGADAERIMAILPGMLRQTEQRTIATVMQMQRQGRLA